MGQKCWLLCGGDAILPHSFLFHLSEWRFFSGLLLDKSVDAILASIVHNCNAQATHVLWIGWVGIGSNNLLTMEWRFTAFHTLMDIALIFYALESVLFSIQSFLSGISGFCWILQFLWQPNKIFIFAPLRPAFIRLLSNHKHLQQIKYLKLNMYLNWSVLAHWVFKLRWFRLKYR